MTKLKVRTVTDIDGARLVSCPGCGLWVKAERNIEVLTHLRDGCPLRHLRGPGFDKRAERLLRTQAAARRHAARCRRCFVPIIDAEGNPGYLSEACAKGSPILSEYINAEQEAWNERQR